VYEPVMAGRRAWMSSTPYMSVVVGTMLIVSRGCSHSGANTSAFNPINGEVSAQAGQLISSEGTAGPAPG
jgi:hypothetical protein